MLLSLRALNAYAVHALDGEAGFVHDSLFDDAQWTIRYFVVRTSRCAGSRLVLVPPSSVGLSDAAEKTLAVFMNRKQVHDSPHIDTDPPVSRRHELDLAPYYGFPYFWGGDGLWSAPSQEPAVAEPSPQEASPQDTPNRPTPGNPHLRSTREVTGYQIHATDGDLGLVADMLVEQASWTIRYLVIDTGTWWGGNTVLIPPQWASAINWADESVTLDMSRETIQAAPRYETYPLLSREQEEDLYRYYTREDYWSRMR